MSITQEELEELQNNSNIIKKAIKVIDSGNTNGLQSIFLSLDPYSITAGYIYSLRQISPGYFRADHYTLSKITRLLPQDTAAFSDIPAELRIAYINNSLKKADLEQRRKTSIKDVKPDPFSFSLLQAHLSNNNLSGVDAIAYLNKVKHLDTKWRSKFFDLIWENTKNKSIAFLKLAISIAKDDTVLISRTWLGLDSIPVDLSKHYALTLSWYQQKINAYNLFVPRCMLTTTHSAVYTWVTGAPRTAKLSEYDLKIALGKLQVLLQLIELEPENAPIYYKVKDHILGHLKDTKKYPGVKSELEEKTKQIKQFTKNLKELHESL